MHSCNAFYNGHSIGYGGRHGAAFQGVCSPLASTSFEDSWPGTGYVPGMITERYSNVRNVPYQKKKGFTHPRLSILLKILARAK